jgi:transcriptional regulator with XRE-family HTH domain
MSTWTSTFAVPPERAAQELLRAIRGEISQVALSRRLGYRSNVVASWEGGHRFPGLDETLRAAELRHIDVKGVTVSFHPRTAELFDASAPHAWLDALRGKATHRDVAVRSGFSEHQVGRWMRGETRPRLPEFLVLLEALTGRLTDWVAALVPIEAVPSLAPAHAARTRVRRLVFEEPWTAGVLPLVGLLQPLHDPARPIARKLGIEVETVQRVLLALAEAGVVSIGPKGAQVVAPLTVDTQPSDEDVRALRRHWVSVSHGRLLEPRPSDRFHYNVFNVSREDLARIHELQATTFRELRAIVAASPRAEITMLYVAHLCSLSEEPTDSP